MTKLKVLAVLVCLFSLSVAVMAKDREYQEGKLTRLAHAGKGMEDDPIGHGQHIVYYFNFHVQVGETHYVGRYTSRKNNLIKKGEWPLGPIQIRFEKKSALIAHVTYMYVKHLDSEKEIQTIVSEGLGKGEQSKETEVSE